jgi:hypothetical protein
MIISFEASIAPPNLKRILNRKFFAVVFLRIYDTNVFTLPFGLINGLFSGMLIAPVAD